MKRAVVTGPTGAVGRALLKRLLSEGIEVLTLCRPGSGRSADIPDHPLLTKAEAGLEDYAALAEREDAFGELGGYAPGEAGLNREKPWDVFYHLAWEGTTGAERNDVTLQLSNAAHALDAVRLAKRLGCTAFIGAGSQAEYGRCEGTLKPDTPAFPQTGYGMAKLAAGQMSRLLCAQLELRHVWARILSVYGPWDTERSRVMSAIEALLYGKKPSLTKGEQRWDYLYSEDAAEALYLLGDRGQDGKIYCLGSGSAKKLREYMMQIRDAVSALTGVSKEKLPLGIGELPYAKDQVMYLCADIADLRRDTGFSPRWTFDAGIRKTAEFVKLQEEGQKRT